MLERKSAELRVPRGARQKTRCTKRCFKILGSPESPVKKKQSAYRITGYLGGDPSVFAQVAAIIPRDPAVGFLDSGVKKPTARRGRWMIFGSGQKIDHLPPTRTLSLKNTFTRFD